MVSPAHNNPSFISSLQRLLSSAETIVLGKENEIRLALVCLLARGHLLIEDHPGLGKTTLAQTMARLLGFDYRRVQFTSDLLPADITGLSIYDQQNGSFTFRPGPIFAQLVLADEVNRATPRAQSALLEAMEERQVTIEGNTYKLPTPFFIIATQNPGLHVGTYPLPESQLDRFLMRLSLGYPNTDAERLLLKHSNQRQRIKQLQKPVLSPEQIIAMQIAVDKLHASEAFLDYLQAILNHTRVPGKYMLGLSPRAGLSLLQAAKAWGFLHGHSAVLPEHLQAVLPCVVSHRLQKRGDRPGVPASNIKHDILEQVPIP